LAVLNPESLQVERFWRDDSFYAASIAFRSNGTLALLSGQTLKSFDLTTGQIGLLRDYSPLDIRGIEFLVPEPSTLALGIASLLSLAALRRRK
jgi:hypothetical protein